MTGIRCKWCGSVQDPYDREDARLLCDRCRLTRWRRTVYDHDQERRAEALSRIREALKIAMAILSEPGNWHSEMSTGGGGGSRSSAAAELVDDADEMARRSFGRPLRFNPIRHFWLRTCSTVLEPMPARRPDAPYRPPTPPAPATKDVVFDRPGRGGRPVTSRRRSR